MQMSPLLTWAATVSTLRVPPTHNVAGAILARVPEPSTIEIHHDTAAAAVAEDGVSRAAVGVDPVEEHDVIAHAAVGVDLVEVRNAAYRVPTCKRKDAKLHLQR
ncbi:hypothetical protein B0H67DRAFT_555683 [Lasiosphaeris hirsuta]|uniref:Uncharacterized protein n=1 Tax=Lasiosphaeris hirsuta TaxID=260670 RepID=A0AA40DTY4_9PEZI|nr:hypothetical protein B0H67DRAFT_555683 [Lasiosphaeris hirsuta]